MNHVKSTGKTSVSSFHPTSKEQQIINKCQNKIKAVQNDANQQIAAINQKAQNEIAIIKSSTKKEAQARKAE